MTAIEWMLPHVEYCYLLNGGWTQSGDTWPTQEQAQAALDKYLERMKPNCPENCWVAARLATQTRWERA